MRACAILLGLAVAGCQEGRRIDILIGPDDGTISLGYTCQDATFRPLALRALDGGTLSFQVVVDFIALGGVPGCRGEEIAAWCDDPDHDCRPVVVEHRFCTTVTLTGLTLQDLTQAKLEERIAEIYDQLHQAGPVATDAPDGPVLIRAVTTTEPCTPALTEPVAGVYPAFDPAQLTGCAYSCPVLLDDVDGDVQLGFDATDRRCEPQVQRCAGDLGTVD
jgi:hypothetical protein